MEENNVISEGFKMTEFGLMPEEWKVVRLGDFAKYINGYAFKPSDWGLIGKPIIRIQNLNDKSKPYNFFDGAIEDRYLVRNGDLLISWSASLGAFIWRGEEAWLNQHIFKVVLEKEKVEKNFLYYLTNHIIKRLKQKTRGSTMKHIVKKEFLNSELVLPPLPEQSAIATVLSTVQDAKEKTDAVITATKELKKSLMKHLFTYGPVSLEEAENVPLKEAEIGMVPEEWEIENLDRYCNFTTGKLNSNQAVPNGKYPFFTCSPETYRIDRSSFDCETVLLAGNNARGIYSVKYYNGKFDAYQRTYVITINDLQSLDYKYLKNALETRLEELRISSIGTSTKFLTLKILNKLKIPLPPLPTQRKIAEILSSIDKKIEADETKKKALDELFKSLLNTLMTAKIRVDNMEV